MTFSAWLIEFVGAKPCPVYATDGPWHTCNPWKAKRFDTRDEAEAWMARPNIVPFTFPWCATSHGFDDGKS